MSNMMPGDNSDAEPRAHDPRCNSLCELPIVERADPRLLFAEVMPACAEEHISHDCTCDDLAELDAYAAAEAWCDWQESHR